MDTPSRLTLVSHVLCPYVQRAAIVLLEKSVPFERRWVDLAAKPTWFTDISPLGKTPVLLVEDQALFESAVICEYLDETLPPRLHPEDALSRARHRGWMEFGSAMLNTIAAFYSAPDDQALQTHRTTLETRFRQLEVALDPRGPFFSGTRCGLVDAVFAPVFRYFDAFEALGEPAFFSDAPRLQAWRDQLARRASVQAAVVPDFRERLDNFLRQRPGALSRRGVTA